MADHVNTRELRIYCMTRGGHTAVSEWIMEHHPGRVLYVQGGNWPGDFQELYRDIPLEDQERDTREQGWVEKDLKAAGAESR